MVQYRLVRTRVGYCRDERGYLGHAKTLWLMACNIVEARLTPLRAHLSLIRRLVSEACARITVSQGGKKLAADWGSHRESTYHSIWLRHNCQCSQCLTSSGQKATASTEQDPHITIAEASITGYIRYYTSHYILLGLYRPICITNTSGHCSTYS